MKKIITFVFALLTVIGSQAEEKTVWEGSEQISWNTEVAPGTQFETPAGTFTGLVKDNVIKVYTTTTYDEPQYVLTYKAGDSWDWTDLSTTVSEGVISYTVESDQIATEIAERGLIMRGQAYTLTKITVTKAGDEAGETISVTIGEDGIATFSSAKHHSFAAAGITPYYASAVATGSVTLTPIADKTTWAYQGYVLKGAAGTYSIPVVEADEDATYPSGTNYLQGTDEYERELPLTENSAKYHYILAKNDDAIGFYHLNGTYTLAAHRAYLMTDADIRTSAGSDARVALRFDDEATAISVERLVKSESTPVYSLQGIRVAQPTSGIYVVNGKKVIIK